MEDTFRDLTAQMVTAPGTSDAALAALRRSVHHAPPDDYLAFLHWSNGAEGRIGSNYVSICAAESVAHDPYPLEEVVPGLLVVASDGGEALFGFDERVQPMPILVTHTDDLDLNGVVRLADSFLEFLRFLSIEDWTEHWSNSRRRHRP